MRLNKCKKSLWIFFVTALFVLCSSKAVRFVTGPSWGLARCEFDIDHGYFVEFYGGWLAKLDFWLLYAKLDAFFVLHICHRYPFSAFGKYGAIPITIGIPLFIFRPHLGFIFSFVLPADSREMLNGWLFGIGVDLGNFLIDFDWKQKSIPHPDIYKKLNLTVGYNLLGLMG